MGTGIVKWFNPTKGYGFIADDGGGPDLFVHRRDVREPGDGMLMEGDRVLFERTETPRGGAAVDVARDATDVETLTGAVKWFNAVKGFGFIAPEGGGADLFMHQDNIRLNGRFPQEGEKVTYEVMQTAKGFAARNVMRADVDERELGVPAYEANAAN